MVAYQPILVIFLVRLDKMLLVKNLFKTIFDKADLMTEVKVITGYTSSEFVKCFINNFKGIGLELYIGMSQQGILEKDHLAYIDLMTEHPNLKIYYQVQGMPTHIKLIILNRENSSNVYVGSANFSYDGLFKHNELMTTISDKVDSLISEQKERSVLATSKKALVVVVTVDEDDTTQYQEDDDVDVKNIIPWKKQIKQVSFRLRRDYKYFNRFSLPLNNLILDDEENSGRLAIKLPMGFRPENYFPIGEEIVLYFEGRSIICKVGGKFNSELNIVDNEQAEIFLENTSINLVLERLNKSEYSISFSKEWI